MGFVEIASAGFASLAMTSGKDLAMTEGGNPHHDTVGVSVLGFELCNLSLPP